MNASREGGVPRLRVWCLVGDQVGHVKPVEEALGARAAFVYDDEGDPDRLVRAAPDLLLCVNDWPAPVARCLDAAHTAGIPSLALQDGILEWRCQYENPLFGAGGGAPQHQPVLADKIACIGAQSARQILAWGNAGRPVVTGMPRLDALLRGPRRARSTPGSRLLVMTAKNPGFTAAQRDVTLLSLRDLRDHLEGRRDVEVTWRISRGLERALGVRNSLDRIGGSDLIEQLEAADAVVTTPSTVMLEAMLLDRPVAVLDYHNVPRFVPSAWTISASVHLGPVVPELMNPPASKIAYQRECLADCLRCDGPAAPRVATLVERMCRRTEEASEGRDPPMDGGAGLPGRSVPPVAPSLQELYPGQPAFENTDVRTLQARLARTEKENESLREALGEASTMRWIASRGRSFARRLTGSR